MISKRRYNFVLAVYPHTRGIAFVLFEGFLAPVDWGMHEARGPGKNAECLEHVAKLFARHMPEVLVLQDMSETGTRRARRIRCLNRSISKLAEAHGTIICTYSRDHVRNCFAKLGRTTKVGIAETIAKHVPALDQYVPPVRRPWMSERSRMGLFDAAALAWTFFHGAASGEQEAT